MGGQRDASEARQRQRTHASTQEARPLRLQSREESAPLPSQSQPHGIREERGTAVIPRREQPAMPLPPPRLTACIDTRYNLQDIL